jgi:orotate phosphoribosyltransferase
VRGEAKQHGQTRRVEGGLRVGSRIAVIEDLVSTAGSSIAAVTALREEGYHPKGVIAIFSYGFPSAATRFEDAGIPFECLSDLDTLVRVIEKLGQLSLDQRATLDDWRQDPAGWSDRFMREHGTADG